MVTRAITLEATAQDPAGVQRVEFYVDEQRIGTDTTSPFTQALALDGLADGAHTIKVAAVDALGRTTSDSRGIKVRKPVSSAFAVDSRASIYGAGHGTLHDPAALAPLQLRFAPGPGKALTVADVSGQVSERQRQQRRRRRRRQHQRSGVGRAVGHPCRRAPDVPGRRVPHRRRAAGSASSARRAGDEHYLRAVRSRSSARCSTSATD